MRSMVTTPAVDAPPTTDGGVMANASKSGPRKARVSPRVNPEAVPEMETVVVVGTATAVTVNVADSEPAGTKTLGGTVATDLELANDTKTPPAGAAMSSTTSPVEVPAP